MTSRLVITNAAAGGSDADAIEAAVEVLRDDGPVTVEASADADELTDVLRRWSDDPDRAEVLVAAGGDGSLHALVAALHRLDLLDEAVVGLVPLGTGNDFARTVDIATDPAEAARQHVAGRPHRLDLLVASDGSVVVNAVHVGVGADAAREAGVWKDRLGRLGYVVGAVQAGLTTSGLAVEVRVDERVVGRRRGRVLQVAVGNGAFVGGGTELTPGAVPDDGEVHVVVSYATAPLAPLPYGLRLRRGSHRDHADVVSLDGRAVTVTGEPFWWNADGEVGGPVIEMSWRVRPGAWTFVVP